jgi:hypothetical protein
MIIKYLFRVYLFLIYFLFVSFLFRYRAFLSYLQVWRFFPAQKKIPAPHNWKWGTRTCVRTTAYAEVIIRGSGSVGNEGNVGRCEFSLNSFDSVR